MDHPEPSKAETRDCCHKTCSLYEGQGEKNTEYSWDRPVQVKKSKRDGERLLM